MAQAKVTLKHKDSDESITVPASAVRVWEKSGWKKAPKSEQPEQP